MLKVILATASSFLLFLCVHFIHFHYFEPYDRVNSVIGAALFGYICFFIFYRFLPDEETLVSRLKLPYNNIKKVVPLALGTILFFLLFIGYLEFYFTADRSITFRMLRITDERPAQSITVPEMLSTYDTQDIIVRRFDDLVYGGYLKKENDIYTLTPKGKLVLGVYRFTIDYMHMRKF